MAVCQDSIQGVFLWQSYKPTKSVVYNGNSDTFLILRAEIYWLWQVSIWQLWYSPVSCTCLNNSILMVGFLLYLVFFQAHSFGADGSRHILQFILQPFKTLFLADYREKQQLGFTEYWSLQRSEAYCTVLAPGRAQLSSSERWEFSIDTVPFEWHFPQGDKVLWLGRTVGLSRWALLSIWNTIRNYHWKLVDTGAMDQPTHDWRKEQPWVILRVLHQFT